MPQKPLKKKRPVLIGVIVTVLIVICAVAVLVVGFLTLYKPKVNEAPGFDTGSADTIPGDTTAADTPPSVSGGQYTRKDNVYNFLFIGKDHVAANTDVIMIVSFDSSNDGISIVQVPRDTYIEYDGYGHKINYLYGSLYSKALKNNADNAVDTALSEFSSIIEQNMCVKIDYYALIDLEGFSKVVDAMGGVTIDIPYDLKYNDPDQDLYIDLKAGDGQVLNGDMAEQFVRFREGYLQGDLGRVQAQKIFLAAFLRQLKDSFTVKTMPTLVQTVFEYLMDTNISAVDAVYFAKEVLSVDLSNAVFVTLPGTDARANVDSGAWYYIMCRADALDVVNKYINVYSIDITETIFDKSRAFTSDVSHIDAIYEAEKGAYATEIYTADQVNRDSIEIPLV